MLEWEDTTSGEKVHLENKKGFYNEKKYDHWNF